MTTDIRGLLDTKQVSELLDITPSTWKAYYSRARKAAAAGKATRFPMPKEYVGKVPLWRRQDVLTYAANRPRKGPAGGQAK
jgi:hypothetical protein